MSKILDTLFDSQNRTFSVEQRQGEQFQPKHGLQLKTMLPEAAEPVIRRLIKDQVLADQLAKDNIFLDWPHDILHDQEGRWAGFLMKARYSSSSTWTTCASIKETRQKDIFFQLQQGLKIAKLFALLNGAGYHLASWVDAKVKFSESGDLYGCDLEQLSCSQEIASPSSFTEWFDPESLDAFKLSVLLFRCLMNGVHPFDGTWVSPVNKPEREMLERLGLFPWIPYNRQWIRPRGNGFFRKPLFAYQRFDSELQALFNRCFTVGGIQPERCPKPEEWCQVLEYKLISWPSEKPPKIRSQAIAAIPPLLPEQIAERDRMLLKASIFPWNRLVVQMIVVGTIIGGLWWQKSVQHIPDNKLDHEHEGKPVQASGALSLKTEPSGSEVFLNENYAGKSPLELKDIPARTYRVRVRNEPDYMEIIENIEIIGGTRIEKFMLLQGRSSWLTVSGNVARAKVYLNGYYVGETPLERITVKPGRYDLLMTKQGYKKFVRESVNFSGGQEVSLQVEMNKSLHQVGDRQKDSVTGIEFMWVPDGCFNMGSPETEKGRKPNESSVHLVCVEGFWMGKTEVTVGQFLKFAQESGDITKTESETGCITGEPGFLNWKENKNASWKDPKFSLQQDFSHPVVCVSWNDAMKFIEWMNRQSGVSFRLPTEAEWEYAARASTNGARYWGEKEEESCKHSNVYSILEKGEDPNFSPFPCNDGYRYTSPVGTFSENAFGLKDMLGNVWEWTSEREGNTYVDRGGSWSSGPTNIRSAVRSSVVPNHRAGNLGFRLSRTDPGQ
ncbi:MAG: SUMF1/EgtB/PvdO family nonheme iron enzyme [Magnetococcales bacterium]|nr:SUMF1/EgtB/PvdO family nonheme iron enzyme [Magnetococcales bacterium]